MYSENYNAGIAFDEVWMESDLRVDVRELSKLSQALDGQKVSGKTPNIRKYRRQLGRTELDTDFLSLAKSRWQIHTTVPEKSLGKHFDRALNQIVVRKKWSIADIIIQLALLEKYATKIENVVVSRVRYKRCFLYHKAGVAPIGFDSDEIISGESFPYQTPSEIIKLKFYGPTIWDLVYEIEEQS